jgi:hypothetical protein
LDFAAEYLRNLGASLLHDASAAAPGAAGRRRMDAFCTTFALGHALRRGFARGDPHDAARLRADFGRLRSIARKLDPQPPWTAPPGAPAQWRAGTAKLHIERDRGHVDLRVGTVSVALMAELPDRD